ncbi:hypothetical protein OHA72_52035 [Dactylosporangium sp. NBC_01737]|uniref:hypothetical protein n=1 Tax=Dactylosporangium sp. NBC_01737 TaxID=2975959 RepID=UPI002E1211BE|nr:hypothetical protein OHA72_52035 [Dactylosporangium sp. NBC_01737]
MLVVTRAVVYVQPGGTTHALPQDAAAAALPTPSGPPLEPRPTGEACRGVRAGMCGDDQGLAPIPRVTVRDWHDRLPQHVRPDHEPQTRDGLVSGRVSYPAAVEGEEVDMDDRPLPAPPALPARSSARSICTHRSSWRRRPWICWTSACGRP